jgi:hypothetical protein
LRIKQFGYSKLTDPHYGPVGEESMYGSANRIMEAFRWLLFCMTGRSWHRSSLAGAGDTVFPALLNMSEDAQNISVAENQIVISADLLGRASRIIDITRKEIAR